VPFFHELRLLPSEDGIDFSYYQRKPAAAIRIAVPVFPRISNFDDLDPLKAEPDVEVWMIEPGRALPGDMDLVILPGSKSTIADLRFLREMGWDIDLRGHLRRGGHVVGICGGYQMLGRVIEDPEGIEGPPERMAGLGLLDIETRLTSSKVLSPVSGSDATTGRRICGFEMHVGRTEGPDCERHWFQLAGRAEGAISRNGRVRGCYIHGLFATDKFRGTFLEGLRTRESTGFSYEASVDAALDAWADHLEAHLEVERIIGFSR
jgi:adenosylcobyric acid synthase